jgi:hypothetical protein
MHSQLHHVAEAAEILSSSLGTPKERLIVGGIRLWAAMLDPAAWPPGLLDKVTEMYAVFLTGGGVRRTVNQMDDETANKCLQQLARDTAELAADIEKAKPRPGK